MNMLFWNIAKNNIVELITSVVIEYMIDVICLAESGNILLRQIEDMLGPSYISLNPDCNNNKVRVFINKNIQLTSRLFEADRILACTFKCNSISYNLAVTHLPDRRSDPDGALRRVFLSDIMAKVHDLEENAECYKSIIIGDFNTDPFSDEMIEPSTLFSTMFKNVIKHNPTRVRSKRSYRVMYNPVLSCISAESGIYGSYYYDKDPAPLYWHSYDQIIVSEELVDSIIHCEYISEVGNISLIKNNRPNKKISDHLPIYVVIEGKNG